MRLPSKSLILPFLILLLVVPVLFRLPSTFAQSGTNVTGIISQDSTWTPTGNPYTLTGNTLVYQGVTLTIQPGVVVNLGNYYIMVNGSLTAEGTSSNPVTFNGGSISFTSSSIGWHEQTASGCIIQNAVLTTAITCDNAVKLNSDTINGAITLTTASVLSNNEIDGAVNGGTVTGNNIIGNVDSTTITNNIITGDVDGGIVSNNTINGEVTVGPNSVITGNEISESAGDAISVGSPYLGSLGTLIIENNVISNSKVGIDISLLIREWFGADIPLIQNNLITQNEVGIEYGISIQESGTIPQTVIENNTIAQNGIGVEFGPAQDYQLVDNNIEQNTNFSIYLDQSSGNINATFNWWGTTDPSAISKSIYDYNQDFNLGQVTFTPFLTAPNQQAPDLKVPITTLTSTLTQSPSPSPKTTSTPTPIPSAASNSSPSTSQPQQPISTVTLELIIAVMAIVIIAVAIEAFLLGKRAERRAGGMS